ncbi:TcpE family conjugal transfer membrane protein, partial [Allosalinactinospora lopnorensis]|uniref:TcpE family conjugal transfer membrane protein n=1 Tax=Allosalinactinospora lopnorensis TaxID=1352348 RepID=UPI000623CD30
MDLPTYTNIWRIEKRLYKLYDFRLPMPLPVVTLGVLLGVCAVWFALMGVLRVPFATPWHVLWLVPPGLITFLATRPVIEGKRLTELLFSQGRFLTEARVYTRLAPEREPAEITVAVRVWHRDPAAGPLPAPTGKATAKRKVTKRADEKGGRARPPRPALPPGQAPELPAPAPGPKELERVREGRRAEAERESALKGEPVAPAAPQAPADPAKGGTARAGTGAPSGRQEHTRPGGAAEEEREPREEAVETETAAEAVPPVPAERAGTGAGPRERRPGPEPEQDEPATTPAAELPEPTALPSAAPDLAPAEEAPAPAPSGSTAERNGETERPAASVDRRGLGTKILNYFGFALHRMPAQRDARPPEDEEEEQPAGGSAGGQGSDMRSRLAAERGAAHGPAPIPGAPRTPEELAASLDMEQRDREWYSSLHTSSGETPWPLSSKAAYEIGDTGPMAAPAADDEAGEEPVDNTMARRRAEEMMAAPEPYREPLASSAENASSEETGGARPQAGLPPLSGPPAAPEDVSREPGAAPAPGGRNESPGAGAARPGTEEQQGTPEAAGHESLKHDSAAGSGTIRHERTAAPPPERGRARGLGAPATPQEARDQEPRSLRRRPHAEPWNLPGYGRGSGGAEESADAQGPASGTPSALSGDAKPDLQLDHGTDEHESLSGVLGGPAPGPRDTKGGDSGDEHAPAAGPPAASGGSEDCGEGRPTADGAGGAAHPGQDEPPERGDRMSVLDHHLSQTDTPPPSPPRFAQADLVKGAIPPKLSGWFNENPPADRAGDGALGRTGDGGRKSRPAGRAA